MKISVGSEVVYNGQNCYLLTDTMNSTQGEDIWTMWIVESTYQPIHLRMQLYQHGTLIASKDMNFNSTQAQQSSPFIPPGNMTSLGYETVTVPAGTFVNCAKSQYTESGFVDVYWRNSNVPLWGLVKTTDTDTATGKLESTMVLLSYGG